MKNSNSNNVTTLDINALTWFDKVNGNSYFSAQIVVDYGTPSEHTIKLPFQYGYGDQYRYEAINELVKLGYVPERTSFYDLKESGIICRFSKIDAKKAEVKQFAL